MHTMELEQHQIDAMFHMTVHFNRVGMLIKTYL